MGSELPPGFRFHPTDEELIIYYLRNQAASRPCPAPIIPEINIYKFDPWELPEKSAFCEGEWYFFTPRDRKYPNGARPNRATASGYWKATGTDKSIFSNSKYVGVKKALVFYRGKPPKGSKTEWIMHEYRLGNPATVGPMKANGSMRLDEWVLCRIYQKKHQKRCIDDGQDEASPAQESSSTEHLGDHEEKAAIFPRSCSLAHLLESDFISASQLFDESPFGSIDDLFDFSGMGGAGDATKFHQADPTKFFTNQNALVSQPMFVDPIFQH